MTEAFSPEEIDVLLGDTGSEYQTKAAQSFRRLYDVITSLRAPEGGCPWDLEQSPETLRSDLIEEVYECIEAIDENDSAHISEELGDIFLLVTMISYMHEQKGIFSVSQVLEGIAAKLVRRHPHVFGTATVNSSDEVLSNWARIKVEQEGRKPKDSLLDAVPKGIPPLERAYRIQKKASKAGFEFTSINEVKAKIHEELAEIEAANAEERENELGDLLFSVVNLCRTYKCDPAIALNKTIAKFIHRFSFVEQHMKEAGLPMTEENAARMDTFWEEAKLK
ncbi:nucleoside triphosphate pyrophosphohydrolase [Breznakiellaceae bacterium SP9]